MKSLAQLPFLFERLGVLAAVLLMFAFTCAAPAQTPLGDAFTYQGSLKENGAPATGSYDFEFSLFAMPAGGAPLAGPVAASAVPVANGLFTIDVDFGMNLFDGGAYFLETAIQPAGGGGFATLAPRVELTAAPNAHFARLAGDADTVDGAHASDLFNQALALNGNDLELTDGNGTLTVDLSSLGGVGSDDDITAVTFAGNMLTVAEGATMFSADLSSLDNPGTDDQTLAFASPNLSIEGGNSVDLSSLQDGTGTDDQTLAFAGASLSIEDGNAVDLSPLLDNTDSQTLSFVSPSLSISGGNSADLSALLDNTDAQDLSLAGSTLSLTGDASPVDLSGFLDNTDDQMVSFAGTTLTLEDGGSADLSSLLDNTDAQTLSFASPSLSISGGNSADLSALLDNTDAQDLSLAGSTLSLTGDASPVDLSGFLDNTDAQSLSSAPSGTDVTVNITGGTGTTFSVADNDNDPTNELDNTDSQTLAFAANMLSITGGNSVDLSSLDNSGTDSQTLSFASPSLSIAGGNSVDLSALQDGTGTDSQTLSFASPNLSITGGNSANLGALLDDTDVSGFSYSPANNRLTLTEDAASFTADLTQFDQATTFNNGVTINAGGLDVGYDAGVNGSFRVVNNPDFMGTTLVGWLNGFGGLGPQMRFQGVGGGTTDIGQDATGSFVVETSDVIRLAVSAGGNVGIGNPAPSERLEVFGNARVTGAFLDSSNSPGANDQVLTSQAGGTQTQWMTLADMVDDADSVVGNEFNTGASFSANTLTVTDGGGGVTADLSALLDDTDVSGFSYSPANNRLTLTEDAASFTADLTQFDQATTFNNGVMINAGGLDVGYDAGVNGSFRVVNNPDFMGTTLVGWLNGFGGLGPQMRFEGVGGGTTDIGQDAAGSFVVETSDVIRLAVSAGGNVGIGNPAPSERLDVTGNARVTGQLRVNSPVDNGAELDVGFSGGQEGSFRVITDNSDFMGTTLVGWLNGFGGLGPQMRFQGVGGGTTDIGQDAAGSFVVETSDVIRLAVSAGGNVGIGNPAPSERLEVFGNARVTGAFLDSSGDAGTSGQLLSSTIAGTNWINAPSGAGDTITSTPLGDSRAMVADGGRFVAGALGNSVGTNFSTVGGGENNTAGAALGTHATVGGGLDNTAIGLYSTVAGGQNNIASADFATVGGGGDGLDFGNEEGNTASGVGATVAGGQDNTASGVNSTIGGGEGNAILIDPELGGTASIDYSTIGGGYYNRISSTSIPSDYSIIGGGQYNLIELSSNGTISGGYSNGIRRTYYSIIGGGADNYIEDTLYSTINGGYRNAIQNDGFPGDYSIIGGGEINDIYDAGHATIGGGYRNAINNNFSPADYSVVGGGDSNYIEDAISATIAGGQRNGANGLAATVPGGSDNTAGGDYSFAAGRRAKANEAGSFVWGDGRDFDIASNGANTWTARSVGGARFVSGIDGAGTPTAGVNLASGGGSWTSISDRAMKENFAPVDGRAVLRALEAVPVTTWNYKSQDPSIRHMGPMAQDLHAAFGLGETDKGIATIDADGVALAAIQGLHGIARDHEAALNAKDAEIQVLAEALAEKGAEIEALRSEKEALEAKVAAQEERLARLERLLLEIKR